ncbi:N-carbamoyl-L-amino acid amidohydrolase [bacterium M00.F.Ca.ET.230.01.1.1]|nr:N-carbamoyl-L-amino acid amidohydrolase [bacterium M00.F.Ca.ET.230.01.1.1]
MADNPYLKSSRLPDVIAAITALGTYKFYKLDAAGWAERISGRQKPAKHWVTVFDEHPEFFRRATETEKFSLVWRRQFPRNYNVDSEDEVSPDHQLAGNAYDRISRRPLEPPELTALINVAVNLHQAALGRDTSKRWWIPLAAAGLGFVGAIIGGLIGRHAG